MPQRTSSRAKQKAPDGAANPITGKSDDVVINRKLANMKCSDYASKQRNMISSPDTDSTKAVAVMSGDAVINR